MMLPFDTFTFVNILRFCDKSCLFPLLLVSKRINKLSWIYLIDFLRIDLNEILIESCKENKIETVKLLLSDSRVDPSTQDNDSIRWASYNGHIEIVKLLLA